MQILVDADACPVKEIIVSLAKSYHLPVTMYFDTSHQYQDGYSTSIQLDKGRDSVDFALVNDITAGDIVVTQDYGLASMALSKQAKTIHPNGNIYTSDNILGLLTRRATNMRAKKKHLKGPKKRTQAEDNRFKDSLESLIKNI
jgi:uncharacterized protein YaiI (UPF0178 family)